MDGAAEKHGLHMCHSRHVASRCSKHSGYPLIVASDEWPVGEENCIITAVLSVMQSGLGHAMNVCFHFVASLSAISIILRACARALGP